MHIAATNGKRNVPVYNPEFLSASGIARMPVPMLPLIKWIRVSQLLKYKEKKSMTVSCFSFYVNNKIIFKYLASLKSHLLYK